MKTTWPILVWLFLQTGEAAHAQFDYSTNGNTITLTNYAGPGGDVTISNFVTSIGESAFDGCTGLFSVTIPNSVTNIGNAAFANCSELTAATIPDSVTSIGEFAFGGTYLYRVTIPNSVSNIAPNTFNFCTHLTSVTIPDSVTNIGEGAFVYCSELASVSIGHGVISIGSYAFLTCALSSVMIPHNVTSIGVEAFSGCSSLTQVSLCDGLTNIAGDAFEYTGLTNVTIPASVIGIGGGAFSGCPDLKAINVAAGNPFYRSADGVLFNEDQTTLVAFPGGITSYRIPDSVTNIGKDAFFGCPGLRNITIPASVRTIGASAFSAGGLLQIYFLGNAPATNTDVFSSDNPVTAYYLPGTLGWSTTFDGISTALWTLPFPLILNGSSGVLNNQFGFTISWATNVPVIVEASADLSNPIWTPIATNALSSDGVASFSDPQWSNYPGRFYRVVAQYCLVLGIEYTLGTKKRLNQLSVSVNRD